MATRTVTVQQVVNELSYLDVHGNEQALGKIYQEVYGDDEVKRFVFKPDAGNPFARKGKEEEGYVLGVGSAHMHFINPAAAQQIAVDRGLQIQDVMAYKSGLRLKTQYVDPEKKWSDTINYDYEFWNKQLRKPGDVYAMLQLDTNLQMGHMAARYTAGIYRLICGNGITSTILALPTVSVRHVEWDIDSLEDVLNTVGFGSDMVLTAIGKQLTQVSHLAVAYRILERLATESKSFSGLSTEMTFLKERFPTISNPGGKHFNSYLEQISLILNQFPGFAPVNGMHIINAYTNAVSVERLRGGDRGTLDALENLDKVVTETVSLANMAAIFN